MTWDSSTDDFYYDLLPLWIILGMVFMGIMGFLIWKICISGKSFTNRMEEDIIDHQEEVPEEKEEKQQFDKK